MDKSMILLVDNMSPTYCTVHVHCDIMKKQKMFQSGKRYCMLTKDYKVKQINNVSKVQFYIAETQYKVVFSLTSEKTLLIS